MKYKFLLIAFITLLVSLTELSWGDTYIHAHGDMIISWDNVLRAVKWIMWGMVCVRIIKYNEKDNNGIPH